MMDAQFHSRVNDLEATINTLPMEQKQRLTRLLEETKQRHAQIKTNFGRLHDALDDWRLTTKYLIFDLERTRLEAQELRRRLDERSG